MGFTYPFPAPCAMPDMRTKKTARPVARPDGRFTKNQNYFTGGMMTGGSFEGIGSGLDPQQLANPTMVATRASVFISVFIRKIISPGPESAELRQKDGHQRGGSFQPSVELLFHEIPPFQSLRRSAFRHDEDSHRSYQPKKT